MPPERRRGGAGSSGPGPVRTRSRASPGAAIGVLRRAGHAHMSVRTFTRRFRGEVGSSPQKWLAQRRLAHARLLLESTDLSVARIAAACGLGDPVALRKHFNTYLGLSPLAYRRAHNAPEPMTAR
ncbi:helix-turn-helix domain-containing protein [Actinomadura sp. ATCC 39365]